MKENIEKILEVLIVLRPYVAILAYLFSAVKFLHKIVGRKRMKKKGATFRNRIFKYHPSVAITLRKRTVITGGRSIIPYHILD